jgi:hypothetical protein
MREFYSIVSTGTPKRDIDLFGPTTVRIDGAREPGGAGVPVIYLSAYVDDPDRLAHRLCAALSWLKPPCSTSSLAGDTTGTTACPCRRSGSTPIAVVGDCLASPSPPPLEVQHEPHRPDLRHAPDERR